MPVYVLPPSTPSNTLRYRWRQPFDNIVRELSREFSPRLFIQSGGRGLGMPEVEISADKTPYYPGTIVRKINQQAGRITLPLVINEESFGDVMNTFDQLRWWFDTGDERRSAPGYLLVTLPDNTVRQIGCYYAGGLEGDFSKGGPLWAPVDIELYAPNPYPTATSTTFLDFNPLDLPELIIMNTGDKDAYPMWRIYGPFSSPLIFENETTGEIWRLNMSLPGGGWFVQIDTKPPQERENYIVQTSDGVSHLNAADPSTDNSWFHLVPGENRINVTMSGWDLTSHIELRFLPRFRGFLR